MSSYKKVAVAGATGNLGPHIVQALIDAGFEVTTLSRSGKTATQSRTGTTGQLPSGIKTVQVDYSSEESLVNALKGQDVFVVNTPDHGSQPALIDAAIKAGVKRFIPSEFGSNVSGNENAKSLPVFGGKVKTQEYLKTVADKISYTIITTGLFLDWCISVGLLVNLKPGQPTRIIDGGDAKHSTTLLSDVGKAVVGVLKHPEETHNRFVKVQSIAVSQNEIIEIHKKIKPEWKPEVQHETTENLLEASFANLKEGGDKIMPAMIGFIVVSAFGPSAEYGNLWESENDNQLLGIKELSREGLEKVVAEAV